MDKFFYILLIISLFFSLSFEYINNSQEQEEIVLDGEKKLEITIKENTTYAFSIKNKKYLYIFTSQTNNIFYEKIEDTFINKHNGGFFKNPEILYVNPWKNISETNITLTQVNIYTELNSFETINEDQYFSIKAEKDSIIYFDSFDMDSKVYMSESTEKEIIESDTRINGKFIKIPQNKLLFIKNKILNISVFQKYFYPLNLNESEINITGNDKSFFYLVKNQNYTFNLTESTMNKMIKLSKKTENSKVTIIKDNEIIKTLNKDSPYYVLEENFTGKLKLEVEKEDAFIEILFNYGDFEVLLDEKIEDHKINKNIEIIKLNFTHKSFQIKISSNNIFNYSLSLGLSNNHNYYYSSNLNKNIKSKKNEEILTYLSLFKKKELLRDEFLLITINLEKTANQDIFISYKQFSELDELMDEKMEPERCQKIIEAIQEALEVYVYLDIAQNPPEIQIPNYHHRKINLKEEIGNISINDRKFYEFYQEIESILGVVRDGHFQIRGIETPKGTHFYEYWTILPFKYIIKEYKGEQRLFIDKLNNYISKYDNDTQDFIKDHLDIPIKTINDNDPFDYIQNFAIFNEVKNVHTTFVFNLFDSCGFYLLFLPLNYTELVGNEFEFEDNKFLRLSYLIEKPEIKSKEFKEYFLKILDKYKTKRDIPPLYIIKNQFLYKKNYIIEELKENQKINWDVFYIEDDAFYLKCKVDHDKKVNIFVQNTFSLSYKNVVGHIFQCAKLFHENKYPIIVIETKNGGGDPTLAYLQIQLFQMREVERTYSAVRYSKPILENVKIENYYGPDYIYDPDTCETINTFNDFKETIDIYNHSDLNITHKRTNVFVELSTLYDRKAFNNLREEYKNSPNLKKPTDIIVFTDGYSFSSGSTFIKGLQNIGGAIIVGYLGNPKIKGTYLFDGSQSDSGNTNFANTDIYKNLLNLGFQLRSITYIEVFNDDYKGKNPIPREYTMIPIDYRIENYSEYSDDILDNFINEGKKIHKMFNEEKYCNYNNTKLLLHVDNKCQEFDNLEHAHGGYKCGENNEWNYSNCEPYYCDIGYSFDQYLRKCVNDCMVDWDVIYIFEDNYSKEYNIDKTELIEFITINPNGSYYVFESSENLIERCPKLCIIKGYETIVINKDRQSNNTIKLKINTVTLNLDILNFKEKEVLFDLYSSFKEKKMIIFQSDNEHILLLNKKDNNQNKKMKYLIYNDSIKYQDILNINEEYFKDYSNVSFILEKGITYIIFLNYEVNDQVHITMNPTDINEDFPFTKIMNYFYLKKDKTYSFKIPNSLSDLMIKLSRETLNSIITINDKKLNLDNLYYLYENKNENKKLSLKIENNDAIIEILYNLTMDSLIENVNYEKSEIIIENETNIFKIPKDYKNIKFEIKTVNDAEYAVFQGYSILPFSHISQISKENRITLNDYSFNISDPYNKNIKIMDNEYYIVTIEIFSGNLSIYINGEKKSEEGGNETDEGGNETDEGENETDEGGNETDGGGNETEESKGLEWYIILLIILGSIIFIIGVIVIIIIIKRKKGLTNEQIEDKAQGLTEV